ncbi:GNAT family N-acetyltransferase [Leifsonia shinshuensis]|uniref:GNAT family N-acetyltransferase n=1 Tax=Leifsonia shinshuensis TaxID=150026 RepID=A0A7G6Y6D4_9MICO|nr:GNAT family N-acetyltransferase [Leifsonia shinshuensis]QNE34049.1 GNAT family N-acetyltransferase [Leifsonia shinshuensis]
MTTIEIDIPTALSDTDLDALGRLLPQLSRSSTFDAERILAMLDHPGADLLVARVDGEVAGMATLASFPLATGWRGHVDDVVVDDAHRGQGVARRLLEAIIELAETRGLRTLDLTSRPSRTAAIALYESVGFVRRESTLMRYAGVRE